MNCKIYESNLEMLEKCFPGMRELIEQNENKVERNLTVDFEMALDGNSIVVVEKEGRRLYLDGKREPQKTAKFEIAKWGRLNRNATVFIVGFANITFIKQLLLETENTVNIMIYEPSIDIFYSVLQNVDISELFNKRKIAFVVEGINEQEQTGLISTFINLSNVEFIKHYENKNYCELFPKKIVEFLKKIDKRISDEIVGKNTMIRYSAVEADNVFHNIKYLCNGSITTQLCEIIPTDIPAIIVSAGPSLNKNIMELKRAKNKAFIVAVDTAVRPLVKAGIIPDLYVIVDGLKPKELLDFDEAKKIPVMSSISATKEILESHVGKKIFYFEGQSFIWSIMAMNGVSFSTVSCGGSVACSAFSLVYKMGFSKIILVGQDLALTGNKTHADGTFKDKMDEIDTCHNLKVQGNYEKEVPTRSDFKFYLDWFNYYIEGCQGIHVINATEGGARIKNTEIMTLHDAIDRECKREIDIQQCFEKLQPVFNSEQRQRAIGYLQTIPEMYLKLKEKVQRLNCDYKKLRKICMNSMNQSAYKKILKKIKSLTSEIEGHEMYDMISYTLSVAEYIIQAEQYYEEEDIVSEGLEIARQGIKYTEMVEKCIDIFIPLTKECFSQLS